jgi:hypothetical protein
MGFATPGWEWDGIVSDDVLISVCVREKERMRERERESMRDGDSYRFVASGPVQCQSVSQSGRVWKTTTGLLIGNLVLGIRGWEFDLHRRPEVARVRVWDGGGLGVGAFDYIPKFGVQKFSSLT